MDCSLVNPSEAGCGRQDVVGPSQDPRLQPCPCTGSRSGNESHWEDGRPSPSIQTHLALQLSRHSSQPHSSFRWCFNSNTGELSLLKTTAKCMTGLVGGWEGRTGEAGSQMNGSWCRGTSLHCCAG